MVADILKENLGIEDEVKIDRAHRIRSHRNANKLKGTNIFINEDFSSETLAYRKNLWQNVKHHRNQGKKAYLNYRSVVVK